jgi:hypothetical protein
MRIGDQALCAVDPEWGELFAESLLVMAKGRTGLGVPEPSWPPVRS